MRYWSVIFIVFSCWKSFAESANGDTLVQVEIIAYRERAYLPPGNTFLPDSLPALVFGRSNLGDLLQRTAPVLISHYGSGNASVSVRGTGDDHTLVLWNGIPLHSVTLGSMDISLLSAEAAPNMQVVTNAGSNVFGSGAFGGVILLDEDMRWQRQTRFSLRADLASFGQYRTTFSAAAGDPNWQFRSATFYQQAKDDFPYTDIFKTGQPRLTLQHNALQQAGTVNTLRWKIANKHIFQAGNWYQRKEKDIPNIMGSYQPSSKFQEDRSVRSFLKYNRLFAASQFQVSAAHLFDELIYTDKLNPNDTVLFINSGFQIQRWLNSLNYRHGFGALQFDAAADLNLVQAKVSAYGRTIREFQGALFAGVRYPYKQFHFSATVRQEYRPGKYIRPMFGVQARFQTREKRYTLEASYSDKYHAPDFNDRYWTPGGNEDLLPEKGYTAELGQQVQLRGAGRFELEYRLNLYYTAIREEIVWKPVSGLIWSPENMQSARHYGAESQLRFGRQLRNGTVSVQSLYLFNRAVIRQHNLDPAIRGNLLAYKPQHIVKVNAAYRNAYLSAGASYLYTGKRFTDQENIEAFALGAYSLFDLYLGFSVPVRPFTADILLRLENVLDAEYQSVRAYARPGRSITLSFILNFDKYANHEN